MFRNEPLAAEANLRSFRIVVRVTSGHVCAQAINMRRDSPQVAATGLRAGTGRSLASQTCTCTACAGFCARRDGWVCIRQAATRHDTGAETQRNAADKRLSGVPGPLRTCVHTISTRTRTHMHTHRRTHTHTHRRTQTQTHAHTHTRTHTHTQAHTHRHEHTRTHTHTHAHTRAHTHTRAHKHTHAHTHTRTHTRTYTHTSTHTHTHTKPTCAHLLMQG